MYHVAVTIEVGRRRRSSRRRRVGNVNVPLCEAWREFPRTLDVYEDNMRTLNEFLFGTLHVGSTFTVTTVLDCSGRGTRRQIYSSPVRKVFYDDDCTRWGSSVEQNVR